MIYTEQTKYRLSLVSKLTNVFFTTFNKKARLAPVLKTICHQCVISYTCSQSISDGSVFTTEPSELHVDWLLVYDMIGHIDEKIVLRTGASL